MQLSAMVGGGQPGFAPLLYKLLIARPEHSTPEQRKALMRRIREALVKLVSICGVCKPLDAIFDIDAITRPEDKDYSFSREGWQCDEANRKRGFEWQDRLYKHNQGKIDDALSSQRDFGAPFSHCCTMMNKINVTCRLDQQKYFLRSLPLRPLHHQ